MENGIDKIDIKTLKTMIGDREKEICVREYQKCNDSGVRKAQNDDQILKTLYKLLNLIK